jgi:hyperosmotically inducible protein
MRRCEPTPQQENHLIREVRHELLMLPYCGVFGDLKFQLEGHTVILSGYVTTQDSITKSDAEPIRANPVPGVFSLTNNLQVMNQNNGIAS